MIGDYDCLRRFCKIKHTYEQGVWTNFGVNIIVIIIVIISAEPVPVISAVSVPGC